MDPRPIVGVGRAALLAKRIILGVAIFAWQATSFAQSSGSQATTGSSSSTSYAPGACTQIPNSKSCLDATPCKVDSSGMTVCLAGVALPSGALSIPQSCWQYSYQFACTSAGVNTCTPYENNAACSVVASVCQDVAQPSGLCDSWNYTYRCQTKAAVTKPKVVCENGLFNADMPTPANTNGSFVKAAIAAEIMRQAQLYSNDGNDIFSGVAETCRKGYAGIRNCCKTASGAKNNAMMTNIAIDAASDVVKYYGKEAVNAASQYMFDAMYSNGLWSSAMEAVFTTQYAYGTTSLVQSAATFQVGAYGFTYSAATTAVASGSAAGTGLGGADYVLLNFGDSGVLMFNPYVFVAAVVVAIIQSLASCSQDEQMLAMHKGANLSVYERTDCSSKVLGGCVEHTDTYCSFNSVLAKIVNVQGKAQLGMNPQDCRGFTIEQLTQVDFSKIDFSEFAQTMADQAMKNLPSSSQIQQSYTTLMQNATSGSAQSGAMATGSNLVTGTRSSTAPAANAALPGYPASQP